MEEEKPRKKRRVIVERLGGAVQSTRNLVTNQVVPAASFVAHKAGKGIVAGAGAARKVPKKVIQQTQRTLNATWLWVLAASLLLIHIGRLGITFSSVSAVVADLILAVLIGIVVLFLARLVGIYTPPKTLPWDERLRNSIRWGIPFVLILVAVNPVWGFSWYFNTENWATGILQLWAANRTETWRVRIVNGAQDIYKKGRKLDDGFFLYPVPGLEPEEKSFSFVVVGDPGEGDASQHVLRDAYVRLSADPKVKFFLISSDVIYPAGALEDYEAKFYLPFKGVTKPIFALPGNHDWYDALKGFVANFFEPSYAEGALRGLLDSENRDQDENTAIVRNHIEKASNLRLSYDVRTGLQRSPYFLLRTEGFSLFVVDTGCLKRLDKSQYDWLARALDAARNDFKMVILGHPLFVHGQYAGEESLAGRASSKLSAGDLVSFDAVHDLLVEKRVDLVMAGDTHYFEYYGVDEGTPVKRFHHFVNGGGGAYLSLGTPLDWPDQPNSNIKEYAYYPSSQLLRAKLSEQTPWWKQWFRLWVEKLHAKPVGVEATSSAFDFNQAPFYQSFAEIQVDLASVPPTATVILYGPSGPIRWDRMRVSNAGISASPRGQTSGTVEFVISATQ